MTTRTQQWVAAVRPATLTAAVGPVAVGTALAAADDQLHLGAALAALGGAIAIQIGTNLFNDYGDFIRGADNDDRLGPPRALQKGWLTRRQVLLATFAAFALAALLGCYLIARAGWPIVAIGIASVASGLLYTGGPKPLAYVGLGDLFVLLFFGVVAVCGTYWVQTAQLTWTVAAIAAAIGALATAILVVNNLRDRHSDGAVGKRTLVVRFGQRFGRAEYATLMIFAYAVPLLLVVWKQLPSRALLVLLSLPLAAHQLYLVCTRDGADLNAQLGGTARVGLIYAALLSLGVVA